MNKRLPAGLLARSLAAGSCPDLTNDPNTVSGDKDTDMLVEAVLLRPQGLLGTVLGAADTLVTLPFTLPGGHADDAARYKIAEAAEHSFNRPPNNFKRCGASNRCGRLTRLAGFQSVWHLLT